MQEISFLTQLQNEPVALLVLLAFVIYKTIATVIPLVAKKDKDLEEEDGTPAKKSQVNYNNLAKKLKKIESLLEKDAQERKKRQDEVDKRLDKQYEYIREAAMQSGVAVVWTSGVPFIELIKAALLNIKLGANGNLQEKLVEAIMKEPNGKTTYKSVLSAYKLEHGPMSNHFNDTISWIGKRIV